MANQTIKSINEMEEAKLNREENNPYLSNILKQTTIENNIKAAEKAELAAINRTAE